MVTPASLTKEDLVRFVDGRLAPERRMQIAAYLREHPETVITSYSIHYTKLYEMVRPERDDEVLVHETFAQAHGLKTGDTLAAVINGRRKRLRIVGIALSPEYVYQLAPGSTVPDFKRFGVLWMVRTPLASAYDLEFV